MTNETVSDEELKSVGGTLLLARTEAGFSLEDIAKKLHLSKTSVQHLENDEFDRLGQSTVFIRGYVRSYARLVGISEEEIVRLLDASNIKDDSAVKKIFIPTQKQISVRDKKMRWLTYGIIILFLILIFIWWRSHINVHHQNKVLTNPHLQQSTTATASANTTSTNTASTAGSVKPASTTNVNKQTQQKTTPEASDVTNKLHMDYNG